MTKINEIPLKSIKRPQYHWIIRKNQNWRKYNLIFIKNDWNTPRLKEGQPTSQTQKMAETPLPPKKCLKYLQSKKINLNTIEA